MHLTQREIEMIRNIPNARAGRRKAAWSGMIASLVFLIGIIAFDFHVDTLGIFSAMFLGFSIARLATIYFAVNAGDKLVDLLLRYIDEDPHAIEQLYRA